MKIQKIGPDSVLVVVENTEVSGNIETFAREALAHEGIPVCGHPDCDAYTAGEKTLIFARAAAVREYYRFDSAEDLIDAARRLHAMGKGRAVQLLHGESGYYISTPFSDDACVLCEYAQHLPAAPEETCRTFDEGAFEQFGA